MQSHPQRDTLCVHAHIYIYTHSYTYTYCQLEPLNGMWQSPIRYISLLSTCLFFFQIETITSAEENCTIYVYMPHCSCCLILNSLNHGYFTSEQQTEPRTCSFLFTLLVWCDGDRPKSAWSELWTVKYSHLKIIAFNDREKNFWKI